MRFKKKTAKLESFISGLVSRIKKDPALAVFDTTNVGEKVGQGQLYGVILDHLEAYFHDYKDPRQKATEASYWEGNKKTKGAAKMIFGGRNYPDMIIYEPYRIAIEYKLTDSGSVVKQGIGQCMMYTMSGEYDFALLVYHDRTKEKTICSASKKQQEKLIIEELKKSNVFVCFL